MDNDLNTQYREPTPKEVDDARKFVLRRESYANVLGSRVDEILTEAAEKIAKICLKYNVRAKDFTLDASPQMRKEVDAVMDEAEEEILSLIDDFSTAVTDDDGNKKLLLLWIASLGRGNMNLSQTLHGYMTRYLYDLEALIASFKARMEKYPQLKTSTVVSQIKSAQHTVYTTPAVINAIRGLDQFQARYIRTHGVHRDDVPLPIIGSSSSNANNVIRMARTTMQMAWMRGYMIEHNNDYGLVGYIVARGSSYPCPLCDSHCHFVRKDDWDNLPNYHPSCCCIMIPVYGSYDLNEEDSINGI